MSDHIPDPGLDAAFRQFQIAAGAIPLSEMTQAETEWRFRLCLKEREIPDYDSFFENVPVEEDDY